MITKAVKKLKNVRLMKVLCVALLGFSGAAIAAESQSIGDVASQITSSFASIGLLITAASYVGGLGFFVGAIIKFKQHKDNPTQIPVGTPIALTFVAAALLFLPSILDVAGVTMFGAGAAKSAGPSGYNLPSSGS